MTNVTEESRQFLTSMLENLIAMERMAATSGRVQQDFAALHGLIPELERIITESYPLSALLDNSDLLVHAEGPGASRNLPSIRSYSWVFNTVEKAIRHYFSSVFSETVGLSKDVAKNLDLRVSGIAPGSIWVGIKVEHNKIIMGESIGQWEGMPNLDLLPQIAENIGDEEILPGMQSLDLDPAFLDSSLSILKDLSPTGNRGIHTLEISTQNGGSARLSQRERVVINQALKGLLTSKQKKGVLQGVIRAADLDKSRLTLRSHDYTVVCIFPAFNVEVARSYLNKTVEIKGVYEMDKKGTPRRIVVESIQSLPETGSLL